MSLISGQKLLQSGFDLKIFTFFSLPNKMIFLSKTARPEISWDFPPQMQKASPEKSKEIFAELCVLNAYIKRRGNLLLLNEDYYFINSKELVNGMIFPFYLFTSRNAFIVNIYFAFYALAIF